MVLPALSLSLSIVEMKRTAACLKWKMWQTLSKQFGIGLRLPQGMQYAEIPGNCRREFYDGKFPGIPGNSRTGIPGGLAPLAISFAKLSGRTTSQQGGPKDRRYVPQNISASGCAGPRNCRVCRVGLVPPLW